MMARLHELHEKLRLTELVLQEALKDLPKEMAVDTGLVVGNILGNVQVARRLVWRDVEISRQAGGDGAGIVTVGPNTTQDSTLVHAGGGVTPLVKSKQDPRLPPGYVGLKDAP